MNVNNYLPACLVPPEPVRKVKQARKKKEKKLNPRRQKQLKNTQAWRSVYGNKKLVFLCRPCGVRITPKLATNLLHGKPPACHHCGQTMEKVN